VNNEPTSYVNMLEENEVEDIEEEVFDASSTEWKSKEKH
jgi:hypothetical protein